MKMPFLAQHCGFLLDYYIVSILLLDLTFFHSQAPNNFIRSILSDQGHPLFLIRVTELHVVEKALEG